jgi:hypothetical protein
VSNVEPPVLRKRLRRVAPLVTAAVLGATLIASAADPAAAAVRQPMGTVTISLASSDKAQPAASLISATRYAQVSDGRFTLTAVPAAARDATITVLPGITLTISKTGIRLSMTKEAVTEVENVVGFGQNVASFVGSILNISNVPAAGGQIASIVANSLGLGNSLLKFCTASDGSATFTVPWFGLPSCSGLTYKSLYKRLPRVFRRT